MQCIILCAGFATRLQPLTLNRPKHLLPIAARPMLDHLLDRLAESGLRRGVLVTNHRFAPNFNDWYGSGRHALELEILDDGTSTNETRLGSIGDLRFALQRCPASESYVVVNGDNLFTFSLGPIFETFRRRGNTIALYDVRSVEVARRMGHATCDHDGRVLDFVEKPPQPPSTMASIGIYTYQDNIAALIDRYLAEGHSADRTGDFVGWLHRVVPVYTHAIPAVEGVWFDIGSFDQYEEANRAFGGSPIDAASLTD